MTEEKNTRTAPCPLCGKKARISTFGDVLPHGCLSPTYRELRVLKAGEDRG